MGEHSFLQYQLLQTNLTNQPTLPPFAIQCSIANSFPDHKKLAYLDNGFIFEPPMPYSLPPISNDSTAKGQTAHQQWRANDVSQAQLKNSHSLPKHIVSPEAIREAEKEEKENPDWPFSNFSTLFALKQRRSSAEHHSTLKVNHFTAPVEKDLVGLDALFLSNQQKSESSISTHRTAAETGERKDERNTKTYTFKQERHLTTQHPVPKAITKHASNYKTIEKAIEKAIEIPLKKETTSKRRTRKSNLSEGQKDPRGRKKKQSTHPHAPKHPMSAYLHYLIEVYPKVSKNFPGSTVGPISKSISANWHAMTMEERAPWQQRAKLDKARYAQELKIYMENSKSDQEKLKQAICPALGCK